MWAVGVLIYTLLARDFPFKTGHGEKTPRKAVTDRTPNWDALEISKEGLKFIKKCLDKD